MCVALNGVKLFIILHIVYVASGFSVTASAIYSGDKITVSYEASAGAVCTCQLDSGSPVSCKNYLTVHVATILFHCPCISGDSGHMFNNVPEGEHTVIVRCTSADGLMTASSTVSALQFLNVQLTLESSGTSITVIPETNIEATHRCRLDNGPFVECKLVECKSVQFHFVYRFCRFSVSRLIRRLAHCHSRKYKFK